MRREYGAKFLAIDVAGLQAKVTGLGAVRTFSRALLTRKIFENDAIEGGVRVHLRDKGVRSTLALNRISDATAINNTTKIETEVADVRVMAEILRRLGMHEVGYQENYREEWHLGDVAFAFDTWPGLPTFVDIEGPDEASVRQVTALLELNYSEARFDSVDELYKSVVGRDILDEPTLLFAVTEKDGAAPVAASPY
ncbi:CYTH domain-containing protein [Streptomyces sp. H10-C2]|uniref:CYTH domain-containing protein n=1 Tax=unclassified Streptomyces TaxID=2593676 RepID=UPI0024BB1612|nr:MULTISPECIES: CYTH domain-containing protein [unclassified Streptomyces]MDJ0346300.1 CYTH domain-containing protein [Streptomyces sp. PH10-H1]MDJ0374909.1 CYTH domain-containing protein [Streptomyces sp. H10-C2]